MTITPTLSAALNFLRFMAALIVVIAHMNMLEYSNFGMEIGKYGHTMVVLFFVISGYIIGRTTIDQNPDAKKYLLNRASRIYIVAIPSFALCFGAGLLIPGINDTAPSTSPPHQIILLLKSIFFLNQSWGSFENPPLNPPFWSLCYEVWYYIIFAAVHYPKNKKSKFILGGLACMIAGPAVLALMPAWLCGLALVHIKPDYIKKPYLVISTAAMLIFFIVETGFDMKIKNHISALIPALWHLGFSTKFLTDYILAVCFALILLSVGSIHIRLSITKEKILANLAGFSFTLYLFHDPVLRILQSFTAELKNVSKLTHLAVLSTVVALCWLISLATEAKTASFRQQLKKLFI